MDVYKQSEPSPLRILGLALHKDHQLAACISKHPNANLSEPAGEGRKQQMVDRINRVLLLENR